MDAPDNTIYIIAPIDPKAVFLIGGLGPDGPDLDLKLVYIGTVEEIADMHSRATTPKQQVALNQAGEPDPKLMRRIARKHRKHMARWTSVFRVVGQLDGDDREVKAFLEDLIDDRRSLEFPIYFLPENRYARLMAMASPWDMMQSGKLGVGSRRQAREPYVAPENIRPVTYGIRIPRKSAKT